MASCRVHVFPPEDENVPEKENVTREKREELHAVFDELFTAADAETTQEYTSEWVSAVYADESDTDEFIAEFQAACERLYPGADLLQTRQNRAEVGSGGSGSEYETVIFLNVTYAIQ